MPNDSQELQMLPAPELKVAAKLLIENGYTSRKVENILGIDHSTATLYAKQEIPEELIEFSTIFNNYIQEQKHKGIRLVYQRILELLPREKRLDQVVKAGEYLEGKNKQPNTVIGIQGNDMSIEFIDAETF